jgi:hypothetical protein
VQLAAEVGLHADSLMNSLRVAAVQGELTAGSLASVAVAGTFNSRVEEILEELSEIEEVPLDKLRGWLLRQTTLCPSPRRRAGTPSYGNTSSPTNPVAFSPGAKSHSPDAARQLNFASFRKSASSCNRATATPSPTAGASGGLPVLPTGNDDVIRAFPPVHNELESKGSASEMWRNSKSHRETLSSSRGRRKGSGDGPWQVGAEKGSANDARW